MQGICQFASGVRSLPATALAFLIRADEILRGLDDAGGFARTRIDAFALAECSIRCALNEVEQIDENNTIPQQNKIGWSYFVQSDEKRKISRLKTLLGQLLSRWPRDEKRLIAADRASGVLALKMYDSSSMYIFPNTNNNYEEFGERERGTTHISCCADASYASAAAALVHGVVGALYAPVQNNKNNDTLLSSNGSDASKKRKRILPPIDDADLEASSLKRASSEQRLAVKESRSETELQNIFSHAAKITEEESTHINNQDRKMEQKSNGQKNEEEHSTLNAKQINALVCAARAEIANGDAMARAKDQDRASRTYRCALTRIEALRSAANLDDRRDALLSKAAAKAAYKARQCGHILENATLEHRWIGENKTSSITSILNTQETECHTLLVHRRSDEGEYAAPDDLFSSDDESSDDEDWTMTFHQDSKWCGATSTTEEFIVSPSKTCHSCLPTTSHASLTLSKKRNANKRQANLDHRDFCLDDVYESSDSILGRGSYGVVRECRRILDNQKFACKTIEFPREISDAVIERIHAEIAAMRKLDHPHICRVHDVFFANRKVHMIIDLCQGGELWQRVVNRSQMNEALAAVLCKQMLSAVRYMHSSGVCHRDLKPQNWLFVNRDPDAPLKLVDFGLAKHFSQRPPALDRITRSNSRRKSRRVFGDNNDEYFDDNDDDDDASIKTNRCCTSVEEFIGKKSSQRIYYFGAPSAADTSEPVSPLPPEATTPRTVTGHASEVGFEDKEMASHLSHAADAETMLDQEEDDNKGLVISEGVAAPQDNSSTRAYQQEFSVAEEAAARAKALKRRYLSDRVGSFYFVAPEVLRGAHDARCDLWSLGVIVYMLLSGVPPFGGRTDRDILARVARAQLTFPARLFSNVSPQARLFVSRLLDRNVDRRITAEQALEESWIVNNGQHIEHPAVVIRDAKRKVLSSRILSAVRKFAKLDALTKLVVCVATCRLPAQSLEQVRVHLAVFDADADGTLSLSQFFDALGGGSDTVYTEDEDESLVISQDIQHAETMDMDDDHHDEKNNETKAAAIPISIEEAAALFDATDIKADGQCISFREFAAATAAYQIVFTPAMLQDVFATLDANGRGYLTPATLRNFVGSDRCIGADDRIDAAHALDLLTGNQNAKLSYPAFAHALVTNLTAHGFLVNLNQNQVLPKVPHSPSTETFVDAPLAEHQQYHSPAESIPSSKFHIIHSNNVLHQNMNHAVPTS